MTMIYELIYIYIIVSNNYPHYQLINYKSFHLKKSIKISLIKFLIIISKFIKYFRYY